MRPGRLIEGPPGRLIGGRSIIEGLRVRTYARTYVRTYVPTYVHTYVRMYVRTYVRASCVAVRTVVGENILEVFLAVRTVVGANILDVRILEK